jgi:hypothetical protein
LAKALLDTGRLAGVALFCVGTASAFGWLLAYYKILRHCWPTSRPSMADRAGFFIAFCFLVVGCFSTPFRDRDRRHRAGATGVSVDLHPVQFAIISIVSLG